jgi:NTP pyrophosphatase (non-canonical NTP hydrolase)
MNIWDYSAFGVAAISVSMCFSEYLKSKYRTTMDDLQADISGWDTVTFPQSNTVGKANHIIEECGELAESLESWVNYSSEVDPVSREFYAEHALEEFSDIFIIMSSWAGKQGFSLQEHIEAKMAKNHKRTWGVMDSRGVVNHVTEG